uniref:Uncharacterized protein n=1 Tax=Anguilla anguilla TaxID=7936 RepID=A0A0E9VAH4_ANGAN
MCSISHKTYAQLPILSRTLQISQKYLKLRSPLITYQVQIFLLYRYFIIYKLKRINEKYIAILL